MAARSHLRRPLARPSSFLRFSLPLLRGDWPGPSTAADTAVGETAGSGLDACMYMNSVSMLWGAVLGVRGRQCLGGGHVAGLWLSAPASSGMQCTGARVGGMSCNYSPEGCLPYCVSQIYCWAQQVTRQDQDKCASGSVGCKSSFLSRSRKVSAAFQTVSGGVSHLLAWGPVCMSSPGSVAFRAGCTS